MGSNINNSSKKGWGDFFRQYGKYCIAGVVGICLILLIVFLGQNKGKPSQTNATTPQTSTDVIDLPTETSTSDTDKNALKKDAYPEINQLMETYFQALKDKDEETLSNIMVTSSEGVVQDLVKESEYIEDYQNIACYTRDGLLENTYIVYICYDIKFLNIETLAPGMIRYYICRNDDGSVYINHGYADGEVAAFLDEVDVSEDVRALKQQVDDSLAAAMSSDEALRQLVTKLEEGADINMAEETTQAPTQTQPEQTEQQETTPEANQGEAPQNTETVYALQSVKIRKSPSTDGEVAGTLPGGEAIERISDDGQWSKVIYQDQECYIASEFLSTDKNGGGGNSAQSGEKVYATQNVNIRATASTDGEVVGKLSGGESIERISDDGEWSKVSYQGKECYIASEFLSTQATASGFQEVNETVTAIQNVNIRATASTDGEVVGKLTGGDTIKRTGYNETWSRVVYQGKTCYIASEFLKK